VTDKHRQTDRQAALQQLRITAELSRVEMTDHIKFPKKTKLSCPQTNIIAHTTQYFQLVCGIINEYSAY